MPYLELEDLHKAYGHTAAVAGVTLAVERGELVSLLGPSGCGKTTTLRIVAGFEVPDRGRVRLDGRDITALPPERRGIGMVFQSYSLFPNMTAAENIAYGLRIARRPAAEIRRRVGDLLDLVGLADAGDRYPHQLSGGMQQRVALARALAIEPRILLLDEPLSALDAKVRVALRAEIRRIQTQLGITALYVTHDQEEALSLSDRVAVMSGGRIEQVGPPEEVYGDPRTEFVASFVGSMNQLAGVVGPDGTFQYRGHLLRLPARRPVPAGRGGVLLVRPEAMAMEPEGEAPASPGLNALSGRVVTRTFLGPVVRFVVEVEGDYLSVDVPGTARRAYPQGARVRVVFDPEAGILMGGTGGSVRGAPK
jgi:putative spermidine/putrescine transport system ATP-binding protein